MYTYQDLMEVKEDVAKAAFVRKTISDYTNSADYSIAKIADDYSCGLNTTIMQYQKTITTVTGKQVADLISPTHRSASNFFEIFVTQLNQYLLGNGVTWKESNIKNRLGADFDTKLQQAGHSALCSGIAYGFMNYDHLEVFSALEFAPYFDEENGALMAGVRFWQVSPEKPMRATLYEVDGYTNYLWSTKITPSSVWSRIAEGVYIQPKRAYIMKAHITKHDGAEIYAGENYPTFPIAPLWANQHKQSELVNLREKIDAYDFILNGFEDDLDNAQIYWIIKGAGGMDDPDLVDFLNRLRRVKAAAPADGQDVSAMQVNIPYDAREKLLDRLEKQLYKDAMILNPESIAGGAVTATQIRAAYERQNVKADQYEYCVIDFISRILSVLGITGTPSFTRSVIVNKEEEVQTLVQAASYLDTEYITRKILMLFGDGDQADEVLKRMTAEQKDRMM